MDDLWASLDNHQLVTTEQGRSSRARRLSEKVVMSELRAWLLHDYVAAYCRSLAETRIFRRCYWIDGLGIDARGTSTIQDSQEQASKETPGKKNSRARSTVQRPHAALQPIISLTQELAQERKPIALYGLMLTSGSSKRKDTRGQHNGQALKQITLPKESGLLPTSWLEAAPTVLNELAQAPAIFLLNPLAATTFTYDDLAPLYQRTVPTELCLLIAHQQVEVLLRTARRSNTHASLLTELLRSDRWKTLPGGEEQILQVVTGWLDLFIGSMQRHFPFPIQIIPLLARTGPATVQPIPYSLIFATRRQDSLVSMNDAVCCHQLQLATQSWQGVLGADWFAQQQQEHWQAVLQDLTQQILQQGRARRITARQFRAAD